MLCRKTLVYLAQGIVRTPRHMMTEEKSIAQVAELEKRATSAEQQLCALKEQLEGGASSAASRANLEARLRELLQRMYEDREECETIRAQRDELKEENTRLQTDVRKCEYRIAHLMRTIDGIENGKYHDADKDQPNTQTWRR
ncbi:hypothetical protein JKF63_00743 [Porcisia hertigi]|uniref:Uncharacterized protein n=1 Tax=Porcisia hertigi TaxID=2761500 RepID=A0A836HQI8_9TRYP|nr:hypothetical protein JKF63_00743 [Porcisia hertigi]